MPTRVVNIRECRPFLAPVRFIYVGRRCAGLAAHPLANPYRIDRNASDAQRQVCLARYCEWLAAHEKREQLLEGLAWQVCQTGLPLGCWCGNWPENPAMLCHAVVLAKEIDSIIAKGTTKP